MALTQVSSGGIKDGSITNADLNASASIAGSKVSPTFTAPLIVNNGSTTEFIRITDTGQLLIGSASRKSQQSGIFEITGSGGIASYMASAFASSFAFSKSRGTSQGTILQANDELGLIRWYGDDGSSTPRQAAWIGAWTDGTPSNDPSYMPGRLVFATTPATNNTPQIRMIIKESGNVSIGTSANSARLHIRHDAADGNARAIVQQTDQRLVFTSRWVAGVEQYSSINSTNDTESAASYLYLNSNKGRVGIGAAPVAFGQLTIVNDRAVTATTYNTLFTTYNGATFENDFAVYFNGTTEIIGNYQNWPLAFMTNNQERMRIRADGQIAIGGPGGSNVKVDIRGNLLLTGNPSAVYGMVNGPTVLPGTNTVFINYSEFNYADNGGTTYSIPGTVDGFAAAQGSVSTNLLTISQQRGFYCANINKAQTNIGFVCSDFTLGANSGKSGWSYYSGMNKEAGCDKYALYLAGTAHSYFASNIGIHSGASDNVTLYLSGFASRLTDAWGIVSHHTVPKETVRYRAVDANIFTEASATPYTIDNTYGVISSFASSGVGANCTVSNHDAFYAANANGATTNKCYYAYNDSAAGKNNWNHYQEGTAPNHFASQLRIFATDNLSENFAVQAYKGSGSCYVYTRSNALANGETVGFVSNFNGNRQAELGVFKHAGIATPSTYLRLDNTTPTPLVIWIDTSQNVRTSSNFNDIGLAQGTVVGTQTSDLRLKNISGPIEYGLEVVKQIEPVRYSLKSEPDTTKIGFIAQEIAEIIPEAVYDTKEVLEGHEDGPTKLAMEYVALIPVLVNAVKELSAKNEELEARLAALEA